ncbi:MAG TPA: class II fructose-bisphosphate aldolase [Candidatus Hydrogenedentes bacterium]|nr:class II fructose-bisphosphate aldolase [Candidatus Hydrogenedentota bacterium]HPG69030.1 class II fructose-bisphosphate aldolase [Candidatus Hydrogenedentota bacterium]
MPVVDFEAYCALLDRAARDRYALPAINVLQSDTLNAAIEGLAEARSDGIIQITPSAGLCTSGNLADAALGAISLAEHAHRIAERYDILIALHTDHCPTDRVDTFLRPLIAETARRRADGRPNLFNSHMYDGSDRPLSENMALSVELLEICRENDIVLEVEVGVFGGEEDGHRGPDGAPAKLYTTPEDMLRVHDALSAIEGGRYLLAAAFGNVHGVYKPGNVVLKPEILRDGQAALAARYGEDARFQFVFHGGSGSELEDIHAAIDYGVVKMNIHTDTQYAFTRAVADHMFRRYDEVMYVDGEVGVKRSYLASTWLEAGRNGMARRVVRACEDLRSAGKTLAG